MNRFLYTSSQMNYPPLLCIYISRKEVICMKMQPDRRAVILGQYIIDCRATVRAAASKFGISKSTVHKDVSERLKKQDPQLYAKVRDVLEINKQERHIRGGMATQRKYRELAEKNGHAPENTGT